MGGIIGVSTYLGVWIDGEYGFNNLFTIILSLLGVFTSLYIAYKEVTNLGK